VLLAGANRSGELQREGRQREFEFFKSRQFALFFYIYLLHWNLSTIIALQCRQDP
jgi:hypothetical protein